MRKFLSHILLCAFFTTAAYPLAINETMELLEDNEIQFVDFAFTDILGNLKEITVPISRVRSALENGIFFDGSSILGCSSIFESDMLLVPDRDSLHNIPWLSHDFDATARIMCDIYLNDTEPYAGSPRYILQQAMNEARALGFEFYAGAELEFFILDADGNPCDTDAYCSAEGNVNRQSIKRGLMQALQAEGITVEKIHHEVAQGQHEIVIRYNDPKTIADHIIKTQHTIKAWARANNLQATFMPKPLFGHNGSGMHIHFSLFDTKNNCNAFYDAQSSTKLSATAQQFIAGVLKYVPELNALLNSTVNSYKRLVPGYEAPIYVCWGTKNRSALIRIPEVNDDQPLATRAEIRSPDSLGNPYLIFATILKAGLAGIAENLTLEPALDRNLYKLSLEDRIALNIRALPTSLAQAVENLKHSTMARILLGERLFEEFVKIKEKEIRSFNTAVTDWEINQYR